MIKMVMFIISIASLLLAMSAFAALC